MKDLPDKDGKMQSQYTIKLPAEIKRRISIINGYKDGLTEELRAEITRIVNIRWQMVQSKIRSEKSAEL